MFGDFVAATIQHFFAVIFSRIAAPKIDTIVPTDVVRFNFFFKIVKIADFEKSTKDFVFVIVVQNARFFQSIEQRFGVDVISTNRAVFDPFDVLNKQFLVDTVKFKAFSFEFFDYFVHHIKPKTNF